MAKKTTKVPVTMRALIQRLNRALAKDGQQLKAYRTAPEHPDFGLYYSVDVNRNSIKAEHVDPEKWARDMGVLKPYEMVES